MTSDLIATTAARARDASRRIAAHIVRTPLERSESYSERLGSDVYFKLENQQETGSFKLRGATNRLLTLSDAERERGCVAASSGNHGAAVACASHKLGVDGVVFVPHQTSAVKVEKIRAYGCRVEFFGSDGLDTELHARAFAAQHGMFYLSPYNDEQVVAGQGTCGIEIDEQLQEVDAVFVAVGGGGLIGGIGAVLKTVNPDVRVIGCQPAASAVMARSVAAGELLDLPSEPTLSDGTAGGIEPDSVTFALNQAVVDEYVVVDEKEIAAAMCDFMAVERQVIEGAAGVALAAIERCRDTLAGQRVVAVICGGNVSEEILRKVQSG